MKKALIIGGGFAGCAAAHQLKLLKNHWDVTLVESASHLGAGVKTQWYGGHPYTFGPRHFLTRDESLFNFLNKYVPMRRLKHIFQSYIESDSAFYNFPLHMDDVKIMPDYQKIQSELDNLDSKNIKVQNMEELWLASVGPTLYEKFAKHYNEKMWMVDSTSEIDMGFAEFASKGSILQNGPKEAFHDVITAYPYSPSGYDPYFNIATDGCNVLLNTKIEEYEIEKKRVKIAGEWQTYDIIVNTISLDQLFNDIYGKLKFVGLDFYPIVLPVKQLLPDDVFFLYYSGREPHKRIVEYKKFTQHSSDHTLIGLEVPSMNGKHYPLPIKKLYDVQEKYEKLLPDNVFSIGRAGSYKYIDIDDCISQAMSMANSLA
jgi:UDP-galactopyranose mutase